jgi:hypothetical protein
MEFPNNDPLRMSEIASLKEAESPVSCPDSDPNAKFGISGKSEFDSVGASEGASEGDSEGDSEDCVGGFAE